ncbi:molybdate ABC transporter substrate-binding protein [Virgibacillus sp. C22-A2]|uniref:Molybdate ABC transporter substrate-binding protein n=1 Tax=Virgibacillus tibetensis TaxID=3042313 RepID=A0ABU6KJP7_9BACI|nr:molybdate ABC transporter substrate-binding protein [Virgibacillus sp. C22-A2]
MKYSLLLLLILSTMTGCLTDDSDEPIQKSTEETELLLSAATSLSEVLPDIIDAYKAVDPYTKITLNFGGSGRLSQQIQYGAPVDIFLSADQKSMDMLEEQSLIYPDTRLNFAKNRLVLVSRNDSSLSIQSLEDLAHATTETIAIGNPESVPAGSYAKEALQKNGVWDVLQDQFIYAKDVRQVLTYVETGNTGIGFVYATDVHLYDKVTILTEIDTQLHESIVYPAAVTSYSTNSRAAENFIEFLESDTVRTILKSHGFK